MTNGYVKRYLETYLPEDKIVIKYEDSQYGETVIQTFLIGAEYDEDGNEVVVLYA